MIRRTTRIIIITIMLMLAISYGENGLYSDDSKHILNLFKILRTSSNNSVRLKAISSLKNIRSKKVLEPIIYGLNDKSSFIRIKCARILGNLNYNESTNAMIRRLRVEKELFVKKELITNLGKLKAQKARWIIKSYLDHNNITLRKAAWKAFNMIENA